MQKNSKNKNGSGFAATASKKTSVDLTAVAGVIKEKYQSIYGLKNILSAGLLLFEMVSVDLRVAVIRAVHGESVPEELCGIGSNKLLYGEHSAAVKEYAIDAVLREVRDEIAAHPGQISIGSKRALGELAGMVGAEKVEKALAEIKQEKCAAVAV